MKHYHLIVSLIKSTIRIITCVYAYFYRDINMLAFGLAAAEVIGVLEELGDINNE